MRAIAINMSAFAPINMSVTISETIDKEHGPQWQRARASDKHERVCAHKHVSVTISETIDEEHGPQWQRARAFLAISMSMSENFWCPVHGALVLNVETELADNL
jgi:hypothetical protein